ncbi:hypothetical protein [Vibrio sinaloensis]|uniref:hypothetical protein n=1 Tax=Photobacterium sp. (strain ATCC 43367) TaxID=379097 RepID=UPI002055C810|nr:hypothetical protein [Vibrio sinaloensis]UPQ87382.1 hypothetical protein MTO69_10160 [Vibrio sinaloensis]
MMTMPSRYSAPLLDFVAADPVTISSSLSGERSVWLNTITLLKQQLQQLPHLAGDIVLGLEHQQQAFDTVILYRGIVFVVAVDFDQQDYRPDVMDALLKKAQYLKQHHLGSQTRFIVPLYLVSHAQAKGSPILVSPQLVANPMCDNGEHLALLIEHFANQYKDDQIMLNEWLATIET